MLQIKINISNLTNLPVAVILKKRTAPDAESKIKGGESLRSGKGTDPAKGLFLPSQVPVFIGNRANKKSGENNFSPDTIFLFSCDKFSIQYIGEILSIAGQFLVHNGAYAGIRPDIDRSFNHINDRIDRQNDPENPDRRTAYTRHQRKCQKIAAHGHPGIADC